MPRVELHWPPDAPQPSVELLKKRDIKLVKKALGKSAADSLKAKMVKDALREQKTPDNTIELKKDQLETVQKSLGLLATERGLTNVFRNYRARRLARNLSAARKSLA